MKIYYDKDANHKLLKRKTIAVIGYGSQGHAHANNLKDSGMNVVVGLRKGGVSWKKAQKAGLEVFEIRDATKKADVIMLLLPDELHAETYQRDIEPYMKKGAILAVAHGFSVHYGQIIPQTGIDVIMIAPKGPGHLVRSVYLQNGGVPCLIASLKGSRSARDVALAYACAIGGGRAGVIETTFREETETDLFGEQAVLCGGLCALVSAGFDTLVDAGYAPEMAYFECLHELKLIVDLLYEGGMENMRYSISNTAEYGDITRGPRLINSAVRQEMKKVLSEIQDGTFAKEFILEHNANSVRLHSTRRNLSEQSIEVVGEKLRKMMPWIKKEKLVDRKK